jgi:hypothetical protein
MSEEHNGFREDEQELMFWSLRDAVTWTLDQLSARYPTRRRSWPFLKGNKYERAKEALVRNNWSKSQKIIDSEFQESVDILEIGRLHLVFISPEEMINSEAPIVKEAAFWGILSALTNQRIAVEGKFPDHQIPEESFIRIIKELGILVAVREYPIDFNDLSEPRLLKKLSELAPDVFNEQT